MLTKERLSLAPIKGDPRLRPRDEVIREFRVKHQSLAMESDVLMAGECTLTQDEDGTKHMWFNKRSGTFRPTKDHANTFITAMNTLFGDSIIVQRENPPTLESVPETIYEHDQDEE